MVTDWHNHIVSPRLKAPPSGTGYWPSIRSTDDRYAVWLGNEEYRAVDERTFDPAMRVLSMDSDGIDCQVLSSAPFVAAFTGPDSEFASLASQQNEFMAETVQEYDGRFYMLAMLPTADVSLALEEVSRLETYPGVLGICLTAFRDDALVDRTYREFWSRIAQNGWLCFVHPTDIAMCDCDSQSGSAFAAMPIGTGRTAIRLLTCGLLNDVANLRFLLSHAGGVLPSILDRLEYESSRRTRTNSEFSPRALARASFWVDTVAYGPAPLDLAAQLIGDNRVIFGTDYPFRGAVSLEDLDHYGNGWAHRATVSGHTLLQELLASGDRRSTGST